jgi:hypothetical protein
LRACRRANLDDLPLACSKTLLAIVAFNEEKQTDLKLTQVTEQHIMAEALGGGGTSTEAAASPKRRAAK